MINIIGIAITFLGTILTLIYAIFSKPNKTGTTWDELGKIGPGQYKNRRLSIYGLSLMSIGFALQIYSAILLL